MIFKIVTVLSIFFICKGKLLELGLGFRLNNTDNFGPYTIDTLRYECCKGPKSKDVTKFVAKISVEAGGTPTCHFNFTFLEQARVDEMRVLVSSKKGNSKSLLWSNKTKKPCEHFVFGPLILKVLKADKNCVVKKGDYHIQTAFVELAEKVIGPLFFYGQYETKTVIVSAKGNIMCFVTYLTLAKKRNGNT